MSTDISIQGRLEGIHVQDVTPVGKNYSDILVIGMEEREKSIVPLNCLSFSLNRSPQSSISRSGVFLHHNLSDVHLCVFVPAIHYLHSVNFVYEMEMFVSDFLKYFEVMIRTFKKAAVGVAKGLVSKESKLAKSLSLLHTSLTMNDSAAGSVYEETDFDAPLLPGGNILYFDISVQSPVIVVPSSLSKEDCLVAHLGEITVKNEYLSLSSKDHTAVEAELTDSVYYSSPPSIERVILSISNIALHSTHTKESRLKLEKFKPGETYPDQCCKVLKEVSVVVQVDTQLSGAVRGTSKGSMKKNLIAKENSGGGENSFDGDGADIVITGKVCDSLLIELPKTVFDQIRTILMHGIRRKPKRKQRQVENATVYNTEASPEKSVKSKPAISPKERKFSKVFASFTLPKLSLELKLTIDLQDRNLVYISFDDLAMQCNISDVNYISMDLTLKSIIIEDLLQPEDSEFRNILASSSKPLPFPLSPVHPSRSSFLQSFSNSVTLHSPFTHHLFPLSHLMSTPKPSPKFGASHSPLRSFSPFNKKKDSPPLSEEQDESGSTVKEDASTSSEGHTDLLTVKAFYVDEKHPLFAKEYDSVSLTSREEGSVSVILNRYTNLIY